MATDLRLDEAGVADDPLYMVAALPLHTDAEWLPDAEYPHQHWLSERVMEIIVGVAAAYGAQFPRRLGPWHERSIFNADQVAWVVEEFSFVGDVLNDSLVKSNIAQMAKVAAQVLREPNQYVLVFEGQ